MTRIAITDDYQNVSLSLGGWKAIPGASVTVFDKPFLNEDEAAEKLAPFDVLSTMRERMALPDTLLARLPNLKLCLLYTSPSPRDRTRSRMPSSA